MPRHFGFRRCREGLEMLQKLCFSSLILLLEASPAAQLSLFLLLSLGFTILQANRKPYRDTAGGAIAMIVNLSIFFLLLSTNMVFFDRVASSPSSAKEPLPL